MTRTARKRFWRKQVTRIQTGMDLWRHLPEKKLELNFVIYTSREELNVYAQAAQASLKDIGINVKLNTVSYETLLDMRDSGEFDMLIWNVLVDKHR